MTDEPDSGNERGSRDMGIGTTEEVAKAVVVPAADDNRRSCWVCFATDEDDCAAVWVHPCMCKGTTKWVHQTCLQRWVDEKQKGNALAKVVCPQCNMEYIIVFPKMGPLVLFLDAVDNLIYRICPFVVAGIVVGSVYWSAATYGAVTIMLVAGHKEAIAVMEQTDPLVLLVGLPTIPILLVLARMIRWEDYCLHFIRKHSYRLPLFRHILPAPVEGNIEDIGNLGQPPAFDPVSSTRMLCGALLLPSLAYCFGRVLFESVPNNFQRTLLGGVAFIAIKGALKIYHKQQQHVRSCQRKILDFIGNTDSASDANETNSSNPVASAGNGATATE